jgi:hypothetical protein
MLFTGTEEISSAMPLAGEFLGQFFTASLAVDQTYAAEVQRRLRGAVKIQRIHLAYRREVCADLGPLHP